MSIHTMEKLKRPLAMVLALVLVLSQVAPIDAFATDEGTAATESTGTSDNGNGTNSDGETENPSGSGTETPTDTGSENPSDNQTETPSGGNSDTETDGNADLDLENSTDKSTDTGSEKNTETETQQDKTDAEKQKRPGREATGDTFLVDSESNTGKLQNVKLTVMQNGQEVGSSDVIDGGLPIELVVSFDVPVGTESATPVKEGDIAVFKLTDDFKITGALPQGLPLEVNNLDGLTSIGTVSYIKGTGSNEVNGVTLEEGYLYAVISFNVSELFISEDGSQKYHDASGEFGISMDCVNNGEPAQDEQYEIQILEKDFEVKEAAGYGIAKIGTLHSNYDGSVAGEGGLENTDGDLAYYKEKKIFWSFEITSSREGDTLNGMQVVDSMVSCGKYIDGTMVIKDKFGVAINPDWYAITPDEKGTTVVLDFKSIADGGKIEAPVTVECFSEIKDDLYYQTGGTLNASNKVTLKKGNTTCAEHTAWVRLGKQDWIEKTGTTGANYTYGSDGKPVWTGGQTGDPVEVTWTVMLNEKGLKLANPVIKEYIETTSSVKDIKLEYQIGGVWVDQNIELSALVNTMKTVKQDYTNGRECYIYELALPNLAADNSLSYPIRLTLTTAGTVKYGDEIYYTTHFYNTARLEMGENGAYGFYGKGDVGIGGDVINKTCAGYDYDTHTIKWKVDIAGEKLKSSNNLIIYDLMLYGGTNIPTTSLTDDMYITLRGDNTKIMGSDIAPHIGAAPTTVKGVLEKINPIGLKYYQTYTGISGADSDKVEATVYTVYQADGTAIGDLVCISGKDGKGLPTSEGNRITFEVQGRVLPGAIVPARTLYNNIYLWSGENYLVRSEGKGTFAQTVLEKDALTVSNISDGTSVPNGDKDKQWTESMFGTNTYDHATNSAVFRLHTNIAGDNWNEIKNADGSLVTPIQLIDTLPKGWEVKGRDEWGGSWFKIYKAHKDPASSTKLIADEALTDAEVANLLDGAPTIGVSDGTISSNVNAGEPEITFSFKSLDQAYMILLSAGPTNEQLAEDIARGWATTVNHAVMRFGENYSSEAEQKVNINANTIGKVAVLSDDQTQIVWKIDYNSHNVDWETIKAPDKIYLRDTMPTGISIPRLSDGSLDPSAFKLTKLKVGSDNALYPEGEVAWEDYKDGLKYEFDSLSGLWVLTLELPDQNQSYNFKYATNVTGGAGKVTNKVELIGVREGSKGTSASFEISDAFAKANADKFGWFEIVKTDETDGTNFLSGAVFGLYTNELNPAERTQITGGATDENGKLRIGGLSAGEYILKEVTAPSGYQLSTKEYAVKVELSKGKMTTSIDGKVFADDTHLLPITNAPEGTPQPTTTTLTISKKVTGDGGDTQKKFDFTIQFYTNSDKQTLVTENYAYTGSSFGTIAAGEGTFTLAHGEQIQFVDIPEGVYVVVTEENYASEGYVTKVNGTDGRIAAGAITAAGETAAFTNHRDIPTGSLTVSKTVTGTAYDAAAEFDFTVKLYTDSNKQTAVTGTFDGVVFDENGYSFKLKDGESKVFDKLPENTYYEVEEADYTTTDGYTTTVTGTGAADGNKIAGTITEENASVATYQNHKDIVIPKDGSLTVSKTVSGKGASQTKSFEFTVELYTDSAKTTPLTGDYSYTGGGGLADGTLTFDADGKATFKLKHGESVKITGIESDAYYVVTESSNSYTATVTGDGTVSGREISGSIKIADTFDRVVSYNNYKSSSGGNTPKDPDPDLPDPEVPLDPGPDPTDPTDPTNPTDPTDPGTDLPDPDVPQSDKEDDSTDIKDGETPKSNTTGTNKTVPKTGDEAPLVAWTLMLLVGFGGALTLLLRKPKNNKQNS